MVRASTKVQNLNIKNVYRFWSLPSNDTIANVVLHEHDLHFQGKNWNVGNISEMVRELVQTCKIWYLYTWQNWPCIL